MTGTFLDRLPPTGEPLPLHGMPEGYSALKVAEAAVARRTTGPILWVLRDDRHLAATEAVLRTLRPDIDLATFPAWDCLPYDRVSPNPAVSGRRLTALVHLADTSPGIVLTTVNAVIQRVPPGETFAGARLGLAVGSVARHDVLIDRLMGWGYRRTGTVMEAGEFAARGSLLDVFPAGAAHPARVDFFGDDVDSIRVFDPMSQRTSGTLEALEIVPFSEVPFDEAGRDRFCDGYRRTFGAVRDHDPLFEAVSGGVPYPGMEHWLPLFHDSMETLLDHVRPAAVLVEHDFSDQVDERWELIGEYAAARRAGTRPSAGTPTYKPLDPERLYLPPEELRARIGTCPSGVLIPFGGPPETVDAGGRAGRNFAGEGHRGPDAVFEAVAAFALDQRSAGRIVAINCQSTASRARLVPLLRRHGLPGASTARTWGEVTAAAPAEVPVMVGPFRAGFHSAETVVITEDDVFGPRAHRPAAPRRRADEALRLATALASGDFVVHVDHGIGRYEGLETVDADGAPHDCLRIVYRSGDRLFVPVEVIDLVSRYGNAESDRAPTLDKLGGSGWALRRDRVRKRVAEMAHDLIRLAAERSERRVSAVRADDDSYAAFCAAFPHDETDDQLETIRDIERDLASERPMDRLVCGDVGFGKTEVALRAARAVAGSGQQVAVVVPTTLLARQHYETFSSRFDGTGISVGQLSRLTPGSQRNDLRQRLADGSLGIVVGTHALLADRIRFANLGLLVVDEEQHFGVAQKERLKTLRAQVHVLTLTATPIPRTLHMALTGVRDLSLISTPPVDRLAIRTYVTPFDPVVIAEAIRRERGRGGQVFCVVPRIRMLDAAERELQQLAPDAAIATAHGRMGTAALEDVMTRFYDQRIDILVSTSIIESGLDIAGANTLIVMHADRFGLSQLYQLRGRIGRRHTRGYAYFTLASARAMTENATKRLQVLQNLDGLGAGFTLASHDLDIRGAGNLLGADQSGHIREVGAELYQQLLREAVEALRSGAPELADTDSWAPQVRIRVPSLIPDDYVADLGVRLTLYRRLAALREDEELTAFGDELEDRFGALPEETRNLLRVMAIRLRCRRSGIERLTAGGGGLTATFRHGQAAAPELLLDWIGRTPGAAVLDPASIRVRAEWIGARKILGGTFRIADEIARLADEGEAGGKRVD